MLFATPVSERLSPASLLPAPSPVAASLQPAPYCCIVCLCPSWRASGLLSITCRERNIFTALFFHMHTTGSLNIHHTRWWIEQFQGSCGYNMNDPMCTVTHFWLICYSSSKNIEWRGKKITNLSIRYELPWEVLTFCKYSFCWRHPQGQNSVKKNEVNLLTVESLQCFNVSIRTYSQKKIIKASRIIIILDHHPGVISVWHGAFPQALLQTSAYITWRIFKPKLYTQ